MFQVQQKLELDVSLYKGGYYLRLKKYVTEKRSSCLKLKFLIPISFQPEGVNLNRI